VQYSIVNEWNHCFSVQFFVQCFCMHAAVIRFLLGPPNMTDKSNIGRIPKVHLSTSHSADEAEECFLIVYRLFSATICLLVEGQFHLLWELFRKFVAWHSRPPQMYSIFSTKSPATDMHSFQCCFKTRIPLRKNCCPWSSSQPFTVHIMFSLSVNLYYLSY